MAFREGADNCGKILAGGYDYGVFGFDCIGYTDDVLDHQLPPSGNPVDELFVQKKLFFRILDGLFNDSHAVPFVRHDAIRKLVVYLAALLAFISLQHDGYCFIRINVIFRGSLFNPYKASFAQAFLGHFGHANRAVYFFGCDYPV